MMICLLTAVMADVNVGLITMIWSITPFFSSAIDYYYFDRSLEKSQFIGILFVVLSVALLSLRGVIYQADIPAL